MLRIDVVVTGDEEMFAGIIERLSDFSPLTSLLADSAAQEQAANLTAGRSSDGPMAPLSARYAARKAKEFPGKGILRATDALLGSIEPSSDAFSASAIFTAPVAGFHFSEEPRSKMPLRDPAFVSDAWCDTALELTADYVVVGDAVRTVS